MVWRVQFACTESYDSTGRSNNKAHGNGTNSSMQYEDQYVKTLSHSLADQSFALERSFDPVGNPLAEMHSGNADDLAEVYHYDAYGHTAVGTAKGPDNQFFTPDDPIALNSAVGNPYAFTGQRLDPSGLMYYKNRYYHTELGRFCSRDPIGYADGTNVYQYADDMPNIKLDPAGLKCCCCCAEKIEPLDENTAKQQIKVGVGDVPGNKITLIVTISKKEVNDPEEEDKHKCKIQWWEHSTRVPKHYSDLGVQPNTWVDAFDLFSRNKQKTSTMNEWEDAYLKVPCPTSADTRDWIHFTDTPHTTADRVLYIVIRVLSSKHPECKCKQPSIELSFVQKIDSSTQTTTVNFNPKPLPPNLPEPPK
jgi:RHS repeat-associated protein